jgi:hypothetical protein
MVQRDELPRRMDLPSAVKSVVKGYEMVLGSSQMGEHKEIGVTQ